eukprot:5947002-Prorocentrum_lima.AAC.1
MLHRVESNNIRGVSEAGRMNIHTDAPGNMPKPATFLPLKTTVAAVSRTKLFAIAQLLQKPCTGGRGPELAKICFSIS